MGDIGFSDPDEYHARTYERMGVLIRERDEARQHLLNLEGWVVASGASLASGISEAVEARLQGRAADVVHERDEARQRAERLDGTLRHVQSIARQSPEQPLLATILAVIEAALAADQPAEAG